MNNHTVMWLEEQVSPDWHASEIACLHVLTGLRFHDSGKHAQAVVEFESAFAALGEELPQKERVWRCFLRSVCELGQGEKELAERACKWALQLNLAETVRWNHDYYWALHNAKRYAEAESYCRRVLGEDPHQAQAYVFLGHMLAKHSEATNHFEEAESVFRNGLTVDESDADLHFFLADLMDDIGRYSDAEEEYRRTLELICTPHDKSKVMNLMCQMLIKVPERAEEVKTIRLDLLKLDPDNAEVLNSLAWSLYLSNSELDEAKKFAQRATQLKPESANSLQTHAAILVRLDEWASAKCAIQKWLTCADPDRVKEVWREHVLLFIDAARNGHANELASLLPQKSPHAVWKILLAALRAYGDDREGCGIVEVARREASEMVLAQLRSGEIHDFPIVI